MMKKNDLLICFASWEDRFALGFERNVRSSPFRKTLVFYFKEYSERTDVGRRTVSEICTQEEIDYMLVDLDGEDPVDTWSTVRLRVTEAIDRCESVFVDISTMPRDIIWYILNLVDCSQASHVQYVYYSPKGYGDEWLSRDPRSPRLIYKLSGLASPKSQVTLLITVGFDLQRATRLIDWCEPNRIIIGCQGGTRFSINEQWMTEHRTKLEKQYPCTFFELDAYTKDCGMASVREALVDVPETDNVLLSSLGPKLTAVSLYKIRRDNKRYGLVYAPSREFSSHYSFGVGQRFQGSIRY